MPVSPYVAHLRDHIGHAILLSAAASAIIRDEAGRVLLIRRGGSEGLSSPAGGEWSLPGGGMEPGETISACVVREAFEETGLHVEPVRLVGVYSDPAFQHVTYPNGDQVHYVSFSFECRVVGGTLAPDGDESLEVAYVAPGALPESIWPGHTIRIQDALAGRESAFFR
jgi:8-oxo-dGTP diphosphatase